MTLPGSHMRRGVPMADRLAQNLQGKTEKKHGDPKITAKTTEE